MNFRVKSGWRGSFGAYAPFVGDQVLQRLDGLGFAVGDDVELVVDR